MTSTTRTNALLTAALATAECGWPVFLLGRSKRPIANCPDCQPGKAHVPETCACLTCHGFYAATTDPDRIAAIVAAVPGGQLATRTGAPSGLLVVDVDPDHGGLASLAALVAADLTPPTARVVTGSGGLHLYYRHPGQAVPSRPLPGYPGVDIKADGGYVVTPPSIHPRTRRPYRWATDGREVEEMPPALITACIPAPDPRTPHTAPAGPVHTVAAGGIPFPDRLLAAHLDAVRRAPVGKRRTTLYGAARGIARMVAAGALPAAHAVTVLVVAGQEAQQSDREIRAAITGGFRDEDVPL